MQTTDNPAENTNDSGDIFAGLGQDSYDSNNDDNGHAEHQQDNETSVDDENDDENREEKPAKAGQPEPDEIEFLFDGKPLESPSNTFDDLTQETESDTDLVKKLRQTLKEQRKEMREKGVSQAAPAAPAPVIELPPYPSMEDEDVLYDPEAFQKKVKAWHETEAKANAQKAEAERTQQALVSTFNARKDEYKKRVSALNVRGYAEAEQFVSQSVSTGIQTAMLLHTDKPELVVLALARNPELLKAVQGVQDPVALGVMLGRIEAKARTAPKGNTNVKGAPASPRGNNGTELGNLDKEIEKARESGDYSRVIQLKKQKQAAAKK